MEQQITLECLVLAATPFLAPALGGRVAHLCCQSSSKWVPCDYWPGDPDRDSQPLPELSRLLAGRHSSLRNGHGDS